MHILHANHHYPHRPLLQDHPSREGCGIIANIARQRSAEVHTLQFQFLAHTRIVRDAADQPQARKDVLPIRMGNYLETPRLILRLREIICRHPQHAIRARQGQLVAPGDLRRRIIPNSIRPFPRHIASREAQQHHKKHYFSEKHIKPTHYL